MDLLFEQKGLLSRREKILIQRYLRNGYGDKEGDLSSHEVKVGFNYDYRGEDAAKTPLIKKGPGKGIPMVNEDGYSRVLRYKGEDIFWEKKGTWNYPKDRIAFQKKLDKGQGALASDVPQHDGGYVLVKDKPYDAKLKAVLAHAASKTVKGHWVDQTPLSMIKKLAK